MKRLNHFKCSSIGNGPADCNPPTGMLYDERLRVTIDQRMCDRTRSRSIVDPHPRSVLRPPASSATREAGPLVAIIPSAARKSVPTIRRTAPSARGTGIGRSRPVRSSSRFAESANDPGFIHAAGRSGMRRSSVRSSPPQGQVGPLGSSEKEPLQSEHARNRARFSWGRVSQGLMTVRSLRSRDNDRHDRLLLGFVRRDDRPSNSSA